MFLLDTNIFLEILLEQKESPLCEKLIESFSSKKKAWISSFSLHSIEYILGEKKEYERLENFLIAVEKHPYLQCYNTSVQEEAKISRLASKGPLDFDDSLHYFIAKKKQWTLITFDKDFKKVRDISVTNPKKIIHAL